MNVVDSSGWLEYFADARNADFFAPAIQDTDRLVVPTVAILEVFKRLHDQRGETEALLAFAAMKQGIVVALDAALALSAATLGRLHRLPLADSIIYATARSYDAVVWTQDSDFDGLRDVRYVRSR